MIPQFEKGVEVVTLSQLKETRDYVQGRGGMPKHLPKIHYKVLDEVEEVIRDHQIKYTSPEVFIHESQSSRLVDKSRPNRELSDYLIQRVQARYLLGDMATLFGEAVCPSVTVMYTEKGVSIAFGMHTNHCYNLAIFGEHMFSTVKTEYAAIINSLKQWMLKMEEKWKAIVALAARLGDIQVPQSRQYELLGHMAFDAVRQNMGNADGFHFNQTEVSGMIKAIEILKTKKVETEVTGWDVLQAGTSVLNPRSTDFNRLLPANNQFTNSLLDYLDVPVIAELIHAN